MEGEEGRNEGECKAQVFAGRKRKENLAVC